MTLVGRRTTAVGLGVLVVAGLNVAASPLARAASGVQIDVTIVGASNSVAPPPLAVSGSQLQANFDVAGQVVTMSDPGVIAARSGMSLKRLVELAGVPPSSLVKVVISRPVQQTSGSANPSTVDKDHVYDGFSDPILGDAPNPQALIWGVPTSGIAYARPMDFPGDDNTFNYFAPVIVQGGVSDLQAEIDVKGGILQISGMPSPSPADVKLDDPTTFTAPGTTLDGNTVAPSSLTYTWDLGGCGPNPAPIVGDNKASLKFTSPGATCQVRVVETDARGDAGQSQAAMVSVDRSAGPGKSQNPGNDDKQQNTTGGGTVDDGTASGSENGPRSGSIPPRAAAPKRSSSKHRANGSLSPTLGVGGGSGGANGDSGSQRGAAGAAHGAGAPSAGSVLRDSRGARASASRQRDRAAGPVHAGLLFGSLVSSVGGPLSADDIAHETAAAQALVQARASQGSGTSLRWPSWTGGALVVLAAVLFGGALELPRGSFRRMRVSWR